MRGHRCRDQYRDADRQHRCLEQIRHPQERAERGPPADAPRARAPAHQQPREDHRERQGSHVRCDERQSHQTQRTPRKHRVAEYPQCQTAVGHRLLLRALTHTATGQQCGEVAVEGHQRDEVQQQICEMRRPKLGTRRLMDGQTRCSEQRRIRRAPVAVHETAHAVPDECAPQVEIGHAIGIHRVTRRERIGSAHESENQQEEHAETRLGIASAAAEETRGHGGQAQVHQRYRALVRDDSAWYGFPRRHPISTVTRDYAPVQLRVFWQAGTSLPPPPFIRDPSDRRYRRRRARRPHRGV